MIRTLICSITASLVVLSFTCHAGTTEQLTAVKAQTGLEDELLNMAYATHTAENKHDEALKVADQAIKAWPSALAWRKKAAISAEKAGRPDRALAYWLYLAELGDGTARQAALRLSRSMNDTHLQHYLLKRLLLAGDAAPETLKEYLDVSEKLGATSEAYNLLTAGLPSVNRELLLKEQARLAESLEKPNEAVNALNKLALIRPLTPEEATLRAKLMFGQGDLERAWQASSVLEADKKEATVTSEPRRNFVWNSTSRRQSERRYFQIDPPSVGAQIKYDFAQDVRTVSGQKTTDRSQISTEHLDLATKGFVYHPALLQFSLKVSPEFKQSIQNRTESTNGNDANSDSFNTNYHANVVILSQKPYTLTLFAHHLETQSWATYTGVTKNTTESYGADFALKYSLLPTTIGFSSSSATQSSYYGSNNDVQEFHLMSRQRGIGGDSSLTSTYSVNKQITNDVANEIKTQNNTFSNQYDITTDGRVNLASNLQYMDQNSASFRNKSLFMAENLSWQHRKNLQSRYSLNYRQLESVTTDSSWASLKGSLTHKLYENLTTTGGISGTSNSYNGGRDKAVGGLLDSAYQRVIGNVGSLNVNVGANYLYTTRTGASATTQVINEPHTLSNTTETFLDRSGINIASIIVTNSDGTIIYVTDVDYRIDSIGSSVRISRVPLGGITDGQLVSVSYTYTSDAAYDDALLTQNYGLAFELKHSLFLTYHYLHTEQTLLSGPQPARLNNATIHLTTLRYDADWSETGVTYEDNNSSSDISYRRWELAQTIRIRPNNRFQYTLRGYYGETEYRSHTELKRRAGATTSLNWMPYNWLRFNMEGYLEQVNSSLEKTVNGGTKTGLEWNYRLWTAKLNFKLAVQDDSLSDSSRTNQQIQLELSRTMW
ncbi:MAG: hypothetical protein PHP95_04445 [Desulfuromonadaceae bacterium]|nr:hypothetical protein [Desulfuromonadaceae bacterium]MDD2847686.1 hypothetical protein [Desulfuromonadaceae bacterium]MDD4131068.1 hypothetical protein [Desulfuromonadaceae bacterium]